MNPGARRPAHSAALMQSPHALLWPAVSLPWQLVHVASPRLCQRGKGPLLGWPYSLASGPTASKPHEVNPLAS
ncbi:hypothetical protein L1987_54333 [Smallanthus sonchifolius]|uniref:Uncharacterized protein n=1 Tax=Smallanthus sonchifolius TaxID=185202 RepID=A0ACB9E7H1_9ASTR|nr:hypothetical protein L1987_54333 [Smallanthus sonchifolius]